MLSLLTSAADLCLTALSEFFSAQTAGKHHIVDCKLGLEKKPNIYVCMHYYEL